jgi:peptidoglycan-associated lipoprotein
MKISGYTLFIVLGIGILLANGCAKPAIVKKDETASTFSASAPDNASPGKTSLTEKSLSAPNVANEPVSDQIGKSLDSIYFLFDSYTLDAAARGILGTTYNTMKKNPGIGVRIEGNCDERGSDEYNLALGQKRADAAKKYLTTMGIEPGRLSTVSYGKERPLGRSHDEDSWARNRRDDFIVISR